MMKVLTQQEIKLLDQEGRSRRENLWWTLWKNYYGTPLSSRPATEVHIERALRSLVPKPPGGPGDKPQSIIIRFNCYKVKEEILRRAWGKKKVFLNGRMIYFDQDYPPAVLQKRKEYSKAKRVLKQNKIRLDSPWTKSKESLAEQLARYAWKVVGGCSARESRASERNYGSSGGSPRPPQRRCDIWITWKTSVSGSRFKMNRDCYSFLR
ncbi:hypothetical protein KUCAC02_023794 [Chaenocephalus aceratus]|uniref:Uncharacterized protein n=1 Tax=Chaenocephalus aceratus TaxID=36190 RepID=A0ACB9WGU1_CHAAC|nr:hypothetical protein KUCAC02_023794 [Chaenocephalus aceratus]